MPNVRAPPRTLSQLQNQTMPPLNIKKARNASNGSFVARNRQLRSCLSKSEIDTPMQRAAVLTLQEELEMFSPKLRQTGRMENFLDAYSSQQLDKKRASDYQQHLDYLRAAEELGLWKGVE